MAMYKRFLLKLSGEQLAGKYEHGIDPELGGWLAEEIKKVADNGAQVVIMVGGGNFVRGAQIAGHGIKRVTADQMGMLGTLINALALTDIFEAHGVPTRCLSSRLAEKHLLAGRVVIVAGGIGRPYLTTDTAAVSLGLELGCQVVLKATKVDGVFDRDPSRYKGATKFDSLSYKQALNDNAIKVMDKAAMGLAMEHAMPLIIFDAMQPDSILEVVKGKPAGTKISEAN